MPDEYIKRDAVLDYLTIMPIDIGFSDIDRVIDFVKELPAADVEPVRHGRWIDENPASPMDPRMRCSLCGHLDVPIVKWRFCPVCGAKIDADPPIYNKGEDDDNQNL